MREQVIKCRAAVLWHGPRGGWAQVWCPAPSLPSSAGASACDTGPWSTQAHTGVLQETAIVLQRQSQRVLAPVWNTSNSFSRISISFFYLYFPAAIPWFECFPESEGHEVCISWAPESLNYRLCAKRKEQQKKQISNSKSFSIYLFLNSWSAVRPISVFTRTNRWTHSKSSTSGILHVIKHFRGSYSFPSQDPIVYRDHQKCGFNSWEKLKEMIRFVIAHRVPSPYANMIIGSLGKCIKVCALSRKRITKIILNWLNLLCSADLCQRVVQLFINISYMLVLTLSGRAFPTSFMLCTLWLRAPDCSISPSAAVSCSFSLSRRVRASVSTFSKVQAIYWKVTTLFVLRKQATLKHQPVKRKHHAAAAYLVYITLAEVA